MSRYELQADDVVNYIGSKYAIVRWNQYRVWMTPVAIPPGGNTYAQAGSTASFSRDSVEANAVRVGTIHDIAQEGEKGGK